MCEVIGSSATDKNRKSSCGNGAVAQPLIDLLKRVLSIPNRVLCSTKIWEARVSFRGKIANFDGDPYCSD